MANTLTYTQGAYSVAITTDGADLTTPASGKIYLNQSRYNKITFAFSDGYSFYLTDFREASYGSSSIANVIGIPSSADFSHANTINAILGYAYAATFDIYDANSGVQLADDLNLKQQVAFATSWSYAATLRPAVTFEYNLGGHLVLNAASSPGGVMKNIAVSNAGIFVPYLGSGWSNTFTNLFSYSLSAPTPSPSPDVEDLLPSGISLGRFTANNEWVGSGEHSFPVLNSYVTIKLSSQLAGFISGIAHSITVHELSALYETPSTVSAANGEHALPFAKISEPLLQEVLHADTAQKPLHFLFASDFSGYGLAQVSNYLTNTPDVLIVNNTPGQTHLHTLDLANFKGLAIVGEGIDINGLTAANNAIVQGDATYNMSAGDELLVLKGAGAYVNGGLGVDTVYFADDIQSRARVTEVAEDRYIVTTAQGTSYLNDIERLRFKDGVTAFDTGVGEHAGEAYRLYQAIFDRTPDQTGLGYWIEQLDNGSTLNDIAAQFLLSNEFQITYGNTTDSQFINLLYQNVLDRTADATGYDYWQGILSSGTARETVLASFSESNENVANVLPNISSGVQYQQWLG